MELNNKFRYCLSPLVQAITTSSPYSVTARIKYNWPKHYIQPNSTPKPYISCLVLSRSYVGVLYMYNVHIFMSYVTHYCIYSCVTTCTHYPSAIISVVTNFAIGRQSTLMNNPFPPQLSPSLRLSGVFISPNFLFRKLNNFSFTAQLFFICFI